MQIQLSDVTVDVVRRKMRNIRLTVRPPAGRVLLSAPLRVALETLRRFALTHLDWIRKQQVRVTRPPRETPRQFVDGETQLVWGAPRSLKVIEVNGAPSVEFTESEIILRVRHGSTPQKREAVLETWCGDQVKLVAPALFRKWEPIMGVTVKRLSTRRMRSRWGSCNHRTGDIRLNTELVRKPVECLEYVVVHEMVHLLEPSHNKRFKALMTRFLPDWANHRKALNRLSMRRDVWDD